MAIAGQYYQYVGKDFPSEKVLCTKSYTYGTERVVEILRSNGDAWYVFAKDLEVIKQETPTTGIKNDSGKRQWWYIFPLWEFIEEVVDVLQYGDLKYPAEDGSNWMRLDQPQRRFQSALTRHFSLYVQGEKIDQETGKSHLAHLITNALFLMWFDKKGK